MEDANDEYGKRRVVLLSQLTPGQSGTIVRRLLEMGLVRGETIRVERVAPLGDPIEFQIKGYHLSLRRQDAAKIEIYISTNGHTKL